MKEKIHSSGWEKIVFLSTLDEARNKKQISKKWEVTISGGPLYKKSTNRGIDFLLEKNALEKQGGKYKANLDSEYFKNKLKNDLNQQKEINKEFADNIDEFVEFLQQEEIKDNLLTPETIKKTFGDEKESQRERVREYRLTKFFTVFLNASVQLWVQNDAMELIDSVDGSDLMKGMVKGMFRGILNDVNSSSEIRLDYFLERMNDVYSQHEESFEFVTDRYNVIFEKKMKGAMP